jgi:hypothetical protein
MPGAGAAPRVTCPHAEPWPEPGFGEDADQDRIGRCPECRRDRIGAQTDIRRSGPQIDCLDDFADPGRFGVDLFEQVLEPARVACRASGGDRSVCRSGALRRCDVTRSRTAALIAGAGSRF